MQFPIKNANRTMNLMTAGLVKKIPELSGQIGKGEDAIAYVKFFLGQWTWYCTEMDPNTGECFGKVFSPMEPNGEWGYFDLIELSQVLQRPGIAVERDKFFKPTKMRFCLNPCVVT